MKETVIETITTKTGITYILYLNTYGAFCINRGTNSLSKLIYKGYSKESAQKQFDTLKKFIQKKEEVKSTND